MYLTTLLPKLYSALTSLPWAEDVVDFKLFSIFLRVIDSQKQSLKARDGYFPANLLITLVRTLGFALDLAEREVQDLWRVLVEHIDELVTAPRDEEVEVLLSQFGYSQRIGACSAVHIAAATGNDDTGAVVISPPVSYCPTCPTYRLNHEKNTRVEAQLFTKSRGILPVYTVSKYCEHCNTFYHPAYWVQNAEEPQSQRVYYAGIPDYIQASETHWVERDLAENWTLQMAVQHASGTGIAEVYNLALRDQPWHGMTDLNWRLNDEIIYATFWVFALLRDKARRTNATGCLVVDNRGENSRRFDAVIDERNLDMGSTGQPMWGHVCEGCVKLKKKPETEEIEYLSAIVLDGVSVRCRCCSVAADEDGMPCIEPLMHPKHMFCGKHGDNMWRCFVRDCPNNRCDESRACSNPAHQALENEEIVIQGQGIRELHRRAARLGRSLDDAVSFVDTHCTNNFTHCEMLALCPCGVIKGRTTLFNAEGIKGVVTWLKCLFPAELPECLPSAFFYDKACHTLKHLLATGDSYLTAKTAILYDLFHGAFCHKEADVFCNAYCNPANFPELLDEQGRIVFNTSACEQANVWFGGFGTMVREMTLAHFLFFLDEMILVHNEVVVMRLQEEGLNPTVLPEEFWNGSWRQGL
ncbi:hypothetical protein BDZ89DRAFT_966122 [Hymenopellis radicata]|nr:hypothetical protein BDZ89DRAFT_966122 [Hymenopellis radicata]